MNRLSFLLVLLLTPFAAVAEDPVSSEPAARWWKGNLHTHSLWSDGDQFPEMIGDWYREHGYNFLALTDHNVLSEGIRWMSMKTVVQRSDEAILQRYRDRFGDAWVETRGDPTGDDYEVRLKPLDEFRNLLEEREKFIMIPAEEISDRSEGKPVHINATNIAEVISPAGGATVREAMQNNLRLILEHEKAHGREVLPHLNHPNFGYAITAEDLAAVVSEQFYEVYNGHPGVNQLGDAEHPSVERIWDLANAIRRTTLDVPPLMGISTDDSHEYHGKKGSRPGRGWVMVRSQYLTPEHLIRAMKRGDFYASSGVTLRDVTFDDETRTLAIEIEPQGDATYQTEFIATLSLDDAEGDGEHDAEHDAKHEAEEDAEHDAEDDAEHEADEDAEHDAEHAAADDRIGKRMKRQEGLSPSYTMTGKELYIRAVITSSKPHFDASFEGQKKQAWTQPVGWK